MKPSSTSPSNVSDDGAIQEVGVESEKGNVVPVTRSARSLDV